MRHVDGLSWQVEKETKQEKQGYLESWQQAELGDLLDEFAEVFKEP